MTNTGCMIMIEKENGNEEEEYGIIPDRESDSLAGRSFEEEMTEGSF